MGKKSITGKPARDRPYHSSLAGINPDRWLKGEVRKKSASREPKAPKSRAPQTLESTVVNQLENRGEDGGGGTWGGGSATREGHGPRWARAQKKKKTGEKIEIFRMIRGNVQTKGLREKMEELGRAPARASKNSSKSKGMPSVLGPKEISGEKAEHRGN